MKRSIACVSILFFIFAFLLFNPFVSIKTADALVAPSVSAPSTGAGAVETAQSNCVITEIGNPPKNQQLPAGCGSGGLTNPFPDGWMTGRLDMGYDGTFKTKIVAPFSGTITYVCMNGCGWGGGYITLRADQKPADLPTSTLYFAEGINPTVHFKQHVNAGDTIATPAPNGFGCGVGCIEWGVAQDGPANPTTNTYLDTYAHGLGAGQCPGWTAASRAMVNNFWNWANKNFHVPQPNDRSCTGAS